MFVQERYGRGECRAKALNQQFESRTKFEPCMPLLTRKVLYLAKSAPLVQYLAWIRYIGRSWIPGLSCTHTNDLESFTDPMM